MGDIFDALIGYLIWPPSAAHLAFPSRKAGIHASAVRVCFPGTSFWAAEEIFRAASGSWVFCSRNRMRHLFSGPSAIVAVFLFVLIYRVFLYPVFCALFFPFSLGVLSDYRRHRFPGSIHATY